MVTGKNWQTFEIVSLLGGVYPGGVQGAVNCFQSIAWGEVRMNELVG